jgi:prepilin-type N-terminal cleavage/methylation domain-containing protein
MFGVRCSVFGVNGNCASHCISTPNIGHRSPGARGFTLIEILVVVGIVLLLASVLVVALSGAMGKSDEARTAATIQTLKSNIDAYSARWGSAPPGNIKDLGALMAGGVVLGAPNRENEGIEALVLALRSRKEQGPYLDAPLFADDTRRSNLDFDQVAEIAMTAAALDIPEETSRELYEFVDSWGNPLVYLNIIELRQGRVDQTVTTPAGPQPIRATEAQDALRHPSTGQFPSEYALWSFGPDGINNYGRGDDITSWPKYED